MVGRPQRFIRKAPSPSMAMILRCGKTRASPAAMEETNPRVRVFKFPSPGLSAHHSRAPQPVHTTKASPASLAIALSNRNAALFPPENFFGQEHRHGPFRILG